MKKTTKIALKLQTLKRFKELVSLHSLLKGLRKLNQTKKWGERIYNSSLESISVYLKCFCSVLIHPVLPQYGKREGRPGYSYHTYSTSALFCHAWDMGHTWDLAPPSH